MRNLEGDGTSGQPVPGMEEQQAVGPGQVVLAAPMALGLLRDALKRVVSGPTRSWSLKIPGRRSAASEADARLESKMHLG